MPLRLAGIVTVAWLSLNVTTLAAETLTQIDANDLRAELDALHGRVVLVNFWATWCRPCLEEIPALMELETQLRDSGFSLVAVSLDEPDGAESLVRPFMEKWFPGFTSFLSIERDRDDMVSVIDAAWNEILPTSYLVARDGSIAERIQGKNSAEAFAAKIQSLIQQP